MRESEELDCAVPEIKVGPLDPDSSLAGVLLLCFRRIDL